jgi:hypothetical protein
MNREKQDERLLDKPIVVPIGDLEAVTGAAKVVITETSRPLGDPTTTTGIVAPTPKLPSI